MPVYTMYKYVCGEFVTFQLRRCKERKTVPGECGFVATADTLVAELELGSRTPDSLGEPMVNNLDGRP